MQNTIFKERDLKKKKKTFSKFRNLQWGLLNGITVGQWETDSNNQLILISKQTDKQINRQTDKQTNRQTNKQTNRHTDTQTNRQTDKQTNRQTDSGKLRRVAVV
jgi:hypothetical protein